MAYDGRGHTPTLQIMLQNHGISKKTYIFYRKRYPNLSLRDLLDLIHHKKNQALRTIRRNYRD